MLATAFAVAVLGGLFAGRALSIAGVAALLAGAAGFVALRAPLELASQSPLQSEVEAVVEATVCSLRSGARRVEALLCDVVAVEPAAVLPRRLLLRQDRDAGLESLRRGERIRAALRIQPLRVAGNPGQRSTSASARRRGVGASAWLLAPGLLVRLPGGESDDSHLASGVALLRDRIRARLLSLGPGGPLLAALAVGDRSALAPSQRDAWSRLGISHLLAVSGLHLGLVAAAAYGLLRFGLVRVTALSLRIDVRTPALALSGLAACLYAGLAGWGVPVQRALVFLLAALAARLVGRTGSASHALAAAALAVLVADPAALFEVGAQLSFAASGALVCAVLDAQLDGAGSRSGVRRLGAGIALGVRTTALAVAVTAPLLAIHGLPVGWAALFANVVAVPLTSFVLLPLSLGAAGVAAFGAGGLGSSFLSAAAQVAASASSGAMQAAQSLPPIPASVAPGWLWVAAAASVAGLALRASGTLARVALAACVVGLLRLAPTPVAELATARVVAFDVGQGDAVLVEGMRGRLLVDAGVALPDGLDLGRSVVLPGLRALGLERVEVLVASHGDADHRGGLGSLVGGIVVDELWLPVGGLADPVFDGLVARARRRGTLVVEHGRGDFERRGDLGIEVLWPPRDARRRSRNDGSLVLRVAVAGRHVLLTGDIGAGVESELVALGSELSAHVLKVAHHGSRNSSSASFLAKVDPELLLLSAACSPRAALPAQEALDRLTRSGAALWWTGRDGAAFVRFGAAPRSLVAWSWLATPRRTCARPALGAFRDQQPLKTGRRFSTKARCASRASSVLRSGRPSSSCRR